MVFKGVVQLAHFLPTVDRGSSKKKKKHTGSLSDPENEPISPISEPITGSELDQRSDLNTSTNLNNLNMIKI
jgi:hypothetical protein